MARCVMAAVCPSVCLSACLVYHPVYLSVCLLSVFLSLCFSVCLSLCLSVYLAGYLPRLLVCLSLVFLLLRLLVHGPVTVCLLHMSDCQFVSRPDNQPFSWFISLSTSLTVFASFFISVCPDIFSIGSVCLFSAFQTKSIGKFVFRLIGVPLLYLFVCSSARSGECLSVRVSECQSTIHTFIQYVDLLMYQAFCLLQRFILCCLSFYLSCLPLSRSI